MVNNELSAMTAVLAGGTAGVGLAAAHRLARDGWGTVVLIGRNAERGTAAREAVQASSDSSKIHFLAADLSDPGAVEEVIATVAAEQGRIDALLTTTHGGSTPSLLEELSLDEMAPLLVNHVMSVMYTCRAVVPVMRAQGSGSIITVSSDAAKVPTPGETVVGAGMAAITTFSKTLAMEVKRHGVRVNIVSPSVVAGTEAFEKVMQEELGQRIFAKITKLAGLGVPTSEDLADLIAFLAGPGSRTITGQAISINGGISAV